MSEIVPQKHRIPAVLWCVTPQGRWEMLKRMGQLLIQPHQESYVNFNWIQPTVAMDYYFPLRLHKYQEYLIAWDECREAVRPNRQSLKQSYQMSAKPLSSSEYALHPQQKQTVQCYLRQLFIA